MKVKRFVMGNLTTNCYILEDDKTNIAAIIDPAICNEKIIKYIDDQKLDIKYILLTHGHFDHIMGSKELSGKYGAEVLISEAEAKLIGELNKEFTDDPISDMVRIDGCFKDGDALKIGDITLDVISTPGHTPGGVSFYTQNTLFSGDTLFKQSIGRTDFFMGDFNQLKASVLKLYKYPDDTVVYPGHGFATKIGSEKLSNPFVRCE